MNNEPVAYGRYIENAKMWLVVELDADIPDGYIPLYTHPAKTLTEDTECQYCKQGCIRCDARKLLTDEEIAQEWAKFYPDVFHTHLIDFARAILKKASEK